MASAALTGLLPEILGLLWKYLQRQNTVKRDVFHLQYRLHIQGDARPYNVRGIGSTERHSNTKNANRRRNKDDTDQNDTLLAGKFPGQHIVEHVERGRLMKYICRWYDYGPDADTVKRR